MDSTTVAVSESLLIADPGMYSQANTLIQIWIGIVALIFLALVVRFTFGVGFTKENPNPYIGETFGMPRGVFRGFLTLSLLFAVLLMEVVSLNGRVIIVGDILFVPEDMYRELMVAFQMMLAFYFGSKVMHHITSADRKKSDMIAKTAKPSGQGGGEFEESGSAG